MNGGYAMVGTGAHSAWAHTVYLICPSCRKRVKRVSGPLNGPAVCIACSVDPDQEAPDA